MGQISENPMICYFIHIRILQSPQLSAKHEEPNLCCLISIVSVISGQIEVLSKASGSVTFSLSLSLLIILGHGALKYAWASCDSWGFPFYFTKGTALHEQKDTGMELPPPLK